MTFVIWPPLAQANEDQWMRLYPDGLGTSIFSSPAWSRLELNLAGDPWQRRFIETDDSDGRRIALPVLAATDRWKRWRLVGGKPGNYVLPIEGTQTTCKQVLSALLTAIQTPLVTHAQCWFPPWCAWRSPSESGGGSQACDRSETSPWCSLKTKTWTQPHWAGTLTWSSIETFLITLSGSAEDYFKTRVASAQRQHYRASLRAGLELETNPKAEVIDEYYALYSRVFDERGWIPPKLPLSFFPDVAGNWGAAAELLVQRHNGRIVGGGVFFYDRFALNFYQAVTDRDTKGVYPSTVIYQVALERAGARGLRYVNLGYNPGSEGLSRFKREWGAVPTPAPMLTWVGGWRAIAQNARTRLDALLRPAAHTDKKPAEAPADK
jgi:hypothetical protein